MLKISKYAEKGNEVRGSLSSRSMSAREGGITSGAEQNRKRGMVLPFEPFSITFDDIRYAVNMPQVHSS